MKSRTLHPPRPGRLPLPIHPFSSSINSQLPPPFHAASPSFSSGGHSRGQNRKTGRKFIAENHGPCCSTTCNACSENFRKIFRFSWKTEPYRCLPHPASALSNLRSKPSFCLPKTSGVKAQKECPGSFDSPLHMGCPNLKTLLQALLPVELGRAKPS